MLSKKIVLSKDKKLLDTLENSFFQREGFALVVIDDALSALDTVESEAPALVLLSLSVMGEDAIACCRDIKADALLNKTGVLLLLPERADDHLADRCWEAGCDAVIHPPLSAERLLEAACKLLGISRRLARRFPVSFELAFAGSDRQTHAATAVNMNDGGMFMATEKLFPVDTRLNLTLTLPGFKTEFTTVCRVAWVNHPEWRKKTNLPCGMGVQFLDLNPQLKAAIQEFFENFKQIE